MPAREKWVSHSGLPLGYYVGAVADSWQTIRIAPWIRPITVSAAKGRNQQVSLLPTYLYQAKILDKTNIVSQREQQKLKLRLMTKIYTGDSFAHLFLASTKTSWVRWDENKVMQTSTLCVIVLDWKGCRRADMGARADQQIFDKQGGISSACLPVRRSFTATRAQST